MYLAFHHELDRKLRGAPLWQEKRRPAAPPAAMRKVLVILDAILKHHTPGVPHAPSPYRLPGCP